MIGALFLAIPRTSLGISVYEREVVRYNHITAAALLLQKIGIDAIIKGKIFGTSFVISFYKKLSKAPECQLHKLTTFLKGGLFMERCDFSSVMTIVRRFISDDYDTNQTALLEDVFSSLFTQTKETITFDMALVCRWFTGQAKISPKITQFYSRDGNREKLAADLENNVLLSMYDSSMAAQEVYRLLMQDDTISERVKKECSRHYPCDSREDEASFIADVLCFGMEREFIKRDPKVKNLLADGKLSPILSVSC